VRLNIVCPRAARDTVPDLKRTTAKRKWWLGRQLTLRIHLYLFSTYLLHTFI
jgi:hypothetical protein